MSKNNQDFDQFARPFLDLWQKQIETAMKDPDLISNMLNIMAGAQKNFMHEWANSNSVHSNEKEVADPSEYKDNSQSEINYETRYKNATKSSTDSSLHGNGNDELLHLYSRIASLEQKVAKLESQKSAKPARPKTSTSRSSRINRKSRTKKIA